MYKPRIKYVYNTRVQIKTGFYVMEWGNVCEHAREYMGKGDDAVWANYYRVRLDKFDPDLPADVTKWVEEYDLIMSETGK